MSRAYRYWGVSRQAYYQQLQHQQQCRARADKVIELVRGVRLRQPRLGARKLHYLLELPLRQANASLGRDALLDVLREAHMLVKTTDSHHRFRRHPNLLKAGPQQVRPAAGEQVWLADITYLPTDRGLVYLRLVTDAWSRKIVGYHVHDSLHTQQVSQALKSRQTDQSLILLQDGSGAHGARHHTGRSQMRRHSACRPGLTGMGMDCFCTRSNPKASSAGLPRKK